MACNCKFGLYFVTLGFFKITYRWLIRSICELSVQMSTTIIFISPLDGPYTADIEMMIILLFCIYWLTGKSIPCILIFEHIPLKSVQNSAEESPNTVCGRPSHYWFDYSQASPRENFEFLCYLKCIFVHFKRVLQ